MFKEDDQILDEAMKFRTQKKLNQIFLDIYDPYYREVIDSERRLFKLEIIEKVKVVPRGLCSAMQTIILSLIEEWFTWSVWPLLDLHILLRRQIFRKTSCWEKR